MVDLNDTLYQSILFAYYVSVSADTNLQSFSSLLSTILSISIDSSMPSLCHTLTYYIFFRSLMASVTLLMVTSVVLVSSIYSFKVLSFVQLLIAYSIYSMSLSSTVVFDSMIPRVSRVF